VNRPTPAIVAQSAVRRLPRIALLLLCVAYVLPGFIGREPWKNADLATFGYMYDLATGTSDWWKPTLMGMPPEVDGLLPYWLGAWAMQIAPPWVAPDFAARIPFGMLLALTLAAMWYGVYYLARSPRAQPVAFAFGGEAQPADYARAIADGGLLALVACLGLAQLSHETTPSLAQLAFTALAFYGMAALARRTWVPMVAAAAGLAGLSLSGAPAMGLLFGLGGFAVALIDPSREDAENGTLRPVAQAAVLLALALAAAVLAWALDEWRWRLNLPTRDWRSLGRLFLWFPWPAWPLALWTLWRWRRQLTSRHVALPLWFALVSAGATIFTTSGDRSLLLGLPAAATLAAFALPTLRRSVAALIDWFTLLFFTFCAVIIWVIWIAMETGVPRQPAANVARLAPGFEPSFGWIAFGVALAATIAWAWLVKWRVGRHQSALWKSLVLPAGGAILSWLLLMTLWMPLLDFARSYAPVVQLGAPVLNAGGQKPVCVEAWGLSRPQIAGWRYHGKYDMQHAGGPVSCPWMLVDADDAAALSIAVDMRKWTLQTTIRRPVDRNDVVLVYRRVSP
jgi:hypothetical protein